MAETKMTEEECRNGPWMHIYGQPMWHADAAIMGTRAALSALRDAIDKALATGMESRMEAFASDGEGYHVIVSIRSMDGLESEPLPYTESYANGRV